MSRLRAIFVAMLTLAVAALPVAGVGVSAAHADCAKASAASHAQHDMAVQHAGMDHASAGQSMADHADGHDGMSGCGHSMCGGKCLCLGLTAVLPGTMDASSASLPRPATARIVVSLTGPAYVPPSPPPRV